MRDPYTVLGLTRSASDADIKKAFRRLAKDNHPDRNANDPRAAERFKEASAAYEILSDPVTRSQFDRGEIGPDGQPTSPFGAGGFSGQRGPGGGAGGNAGFRSGRSGFDFAGTADDLFSELFGAGGGAGGRGGFRTDPRGPDVAYRLNVPFIDAVRLNPQRVTLKSGQVIEIKLPAGIESGKQVRLGGRGEMGPGGPGDALVTFDIAAHRVLERDGDDIRLNLPVRLDEAVLGAKVRMPTADGPVTLTIPPGTSSGRVFRLKGRGFTRSDGSRGDQLVTVLIDIPPDHEALRRFAEDFIDGRDLRAAFEL